MFCYTDVNQVCQQLISQKGALDSAEAGLKLIVL